MAIAKAVMTAARCLPSLYRVLFAPLSPPHGYGGELTVCPVDEVTQLGHGEPIQAGGESAESANTGIVRIIWGDRVLVITMATASKLFWKYCFFEKFFQNYIGP